MNEKLESALKGIFDSLTEEQKEQAKACANMDELTALLGKLGVELPDELLEDGGGGFDLGSIVTRPLKLPAFGTIQETSGGSLGTTHMDIKDDKSVGAVHMDTAGTTKKKKSTFSWV